VAKHKKVEQEIRGVALWQEETKERRKIGRDPPIKVSRGEATLCFPVLVHHHREKHLPIRL
jgi:hypothetical protein